MNRKNKKRYNRLYWRSILINMQKLKIFLAVLSIGVFCIFNEIARVDGHNFEAGVENSIDKIIEKHWKKHLSNQPNERRSSLEVPSTINNDWNHQCEHDSIEKEEISKLKQNLKKQIEENPELATEQRRERGVSRKRQTNQAWESIRFFVNNTYIAANDPRSCQTVGQKIPIGNPKVNVACDRNGRINCYLTCTSQDILSASLRSLISNDIMPAVLDVFENLLTIKRVQGNLLLNKLVYDSYGGECYTGVPIASRYVRGIGTGIANSDMLVYFSARPAQADGIVAFATGCNFEWDGQNEDYGFGRPLAGYVNFNPLHFQKFTTGNYNQFDFKSAIKVGVHEFTHAMGFSSLFYQSYLNDDGQRWDAATRTYLRRGTNPSGGSFAVNITEIITPRVAKVSQDHYQCDEIVGIETEDYGGSGTAGSHWEGRLVNNEYMAGYINPLMPVSYLTLSLFEDMGWYKSNFELAERWGWGKDQGCPFVLERCETGWSGEGYFCANDNNGCSADRQAKGQCYYGNFQSALPNYYQHFTLPNVGGGTPSMDYCPYNEYYVFCRNESESANAGIYEVFGDSSICFEFAVGSNKVSTNPPQACWPTQCLEEQQLQVQINGKWLNCPKNGGKLEVDEIDGVINCPTGSSICRKIGEPVIGGSSSISYSILLIILSIAFMFAV